MKRHRGRVHPIEHYRPLMDWWVAGVVALLLCLLLAMLPSILWSSLPAWQTAVMALCLVAIILYVIDSAFFTSYYLKDSGLVIVSQLRQYCFPYRSMRTIRSSGLRGLFSFGQRKRFSLSSCGYEILLDGLAWKIVSVSPKERDRFIAALLTRIDDDRSKRVTIDA